MIKTKCKILERQKKMIQEEKDNLNRLMASKYIELITLKLPTEKKLSLRWFPW